MFCALSGISLSWKTLVFGRFTSQERTNVHRTAYFLHTPDFSLCKVTALKVVWGKDTSRRSKEPGSDLPSCFSAWAPFCKCGWRHHISARSGCGPDWPIGHNNTKLFCAQSGPALAWPFGNGQVRVGTQGLFRLCLKTFVAPFLPARLTAPGSPRMIFTKLKYLSKEWIYFSVLSHKKKLFSFSIF